MALFYIVAAGIFMIGFGELIAATKEIAVNTRPTEEKKERTFSLVATLVQLVGALVIVIPVVLALWQ